jgi:hypothetical protein
MWKQEIVSCEDWFSKIDYLGTGKGEGTLDLLVQHVKGGNDISRVPDLLYSQQRNPLLVKSAGQPTFDSLPAPDFSGLPINRYMSGEMQLGLTTCIGCYWGRCVFCSYGRRSHENKSYEQATPQVLADWIQHLVKEYQAHRINFIDENTNLKLIVAAMRLVRSAGIQVYFSTRNRFEKVLLNGDFCKELAALGCVLMSCGYETNSQRLLDRLDKGVSAEHYQAIIDNIHIAGITLRLSVMGGILDETEIEFRESLEFLKSNEQKIGIDILQNLVVEPGTPLADTPNSFNIWVSKLEPLDNNSALNYAGGRFGFKSSLENKGTHNLLEIFTSVRPQKNDELPPDNAIQSASMDGKIYAISLHPWVRVLNATDGSYVVDLLWQRIYRINAQFESKVLERSTTTILTTANCSTSVLSYLVRDGLAEPVN